MFFTAHLVSLPFVPHTVNNTPFFHYISMYKKEATLLLKLRTYLQKFIFFQSCHFHKNKTSRNMINIIFLEVLSPNNATYLMVYLKQLYLLFFTLINLPSTICKSVLYIVTIHTFSYQSTFTASFIPLMYSFTYGTQSSPYCPHSLTIALPTMAPSDTAAIFAACSGVEIPNPMAHGMSFASLTSFTMAPMSVVISFRTPVTPRDETQ